MVCLQGGVPRLWAVRGSVRLRREWAAFLHRGKGKIHNAVRLIFHETSPCSHVWEPWEQGETVNPQSQAGSVFCLQGLTIHTIQWTSSENDDSVPGSSFLARKSCFLPSLPMERAAFVPTRLSLWAQSLWMFHESNDRSLPGSSSDWQAALSNHRT